MSTKRLALVGLIAIFAAVGASSASAKTTLRVTWMRGVSARATPAKYDRVGVIKVGPRSAKNVLVLEPGTSAGGAYFVPLAQWLVRTLPGWQVWSIERRENLLEDQSLLTPAKQGKDGPQAVFDYYLGYLTNPSIKRHVQNVADSKVQFAKQWGTSVAVGDMHRVIQAAKKLGGKVVLGGHSLGGSLVTAYATWNFGGRPGATDLAGLVFDDGAGAGKPGSAQDATNALETLRSPSTSPWLPFGFPAPFLGLYGSTGALAAYTFPNQPSIGQTFSLLPSALNPGVRVTNLALFAYNTNVSTSKLTTLNAGGFAFLAHLGKGIATKQFSGARAWDASGALTPVRRWAAMLSGPDVANADGVEWYFPDRLFVESLQLGAIDQGNANAAQQALGLKSTMGHRLPRRLLMYAFGAFGGKGITAATSQLAKQSNIPGRNLTLVSRQGIYAHNDPAGAYPRNVFFTNLVKFLKKVGRG